MVKAIFYVLGGFCVLVMGTLGYLGIALLMGIESACIPLPSELIMPYAGALSDPGVSAALLETYKTLERLDTPEAGNARAEIRHELTVDYNASPEARTLLPGS